MESPISFVHKYFGIYLNSGDGFYFLHEENSLQKCEDWVNQFYTSVRNETPDRIKIYNRFNKLVKTIYIG